MIFDFPAIIPNAATWGLVANTTSSRSELNGVGQDFALPGDFWKGTLTFTNVKPPRSNVLCAFIASLRGKSGRFTMTPPGYRGPASGELGDISALWASGGSITTYSPAVKADSTIITADSTLTADATRYWLSIGDYIEVLGELKMVTASVTDPGAGTCAISFVPPLRQAVPSGTPIITAQPKCRMKLSDNNQAQWPVQPGKIYAFSMGIEEAIDL